MKSLEDRLSKMEEPLAGIQVSVRKIQSCVLPPLESGIGDEMPDFPMDSKEQENKFIAMLANPEKFNQTVRGNP